MNNTKLYKIIVVGDQNVGKTSLIERLVHRDFRNTLNLRFAQISSIKYSTTSTVTRSILSNSGMSLARNDISPSQISTFGGPAPA